MKLALPEKFCMKKQAESWLESAKSDLLVIEGIIENDLLTHMVAFHAQQAIEKTLKAVLEEKDQRISKTHNLTVLSENVLKEIEYEFDLDLIDQLNELYIESRYPTELGLLPSGKPTKEISEKFYEYAKQIFVDIKEKIDE